MTDSEDGEENVCINEIVDLNELYMGSDSEIQPLIDETNENINTEKTDIEDVFEKMDIFEKIDMFEKMDMMEQDESVIDNINSVGINSDGINSVDIRGRCIIL